MLINQANIQSLFAGYKTSFQKAFDGTVSTYDQIAMISPSQNSEENYVWLSEFARFREWLGDRVIRNLSAQNYVVKNRKFEDTVSVSRDKVEDDNYGIFAPIFSEMGRAARQHPDELVYALLATGFAALCYDGQNFFDIDHPVIDANGNEQSVSNMQAGATDPWYLIDSSRMIRPIIWQQRTPYEFQSLDQGSDQNVFLRDEFLYGVRARANAGFGLWQLAFGSKDTLDTTNYEAARQAMMALKGDHGKPLGIKPTHLVVPNSLEGAARRLLVNQVKDAGASNEWAGSAELIVTPYL